MCNKKLMPLFLFLLFVACGSVDDLKSPTANTSIDNPTNSPFTFTGTGMSITKVFHCGGELVTFKLSHTGASNFIVRLRISGSGKVSAYLVNEIGAFTGTVPKNPTEGDYFLEVDADGDWTINVTGDVS